MRKKDVAAAREKAPPTTLGDMALAVHEAACEGLDLADITEAVRRQGQKAREGNCASLKFLLNYFAPPVSPTPPVPPPPPPPGEVATCGGAAKMPADLLRKLVAAHLFINGETEIAALAAHWGVAPDDLAAATADHEWFARKGRELKLTPAGKAAVG